jgi:hypothetical protein
VDVPKFAVSQFDGFPNKTPRVHTTRANTEVLLHHESYSTIIPTTQGVTMAASQPKGRNMDANASAKVILQ